MSLETRNPNSSFLVEPPKRSFWRFWFYDLLLILIVLAGAYFRTVGLNWDQNEHLHPDERFMTMVESAMSPVQNASQYFNTAISPLNPNNVGYGFYVYGDLPIILTRYVGDWLHQVGYNQIYLIGRQLSAFADLLTVLLVYLIASKLYGKLAGVLAAAFAAFSVLPIQLSHYFTVDTFTNFFTFVAFYYAVRVMVDSPRFFPLKVDQSRIYSHGEPVSGSHFIAYRGPEQGYRFSDFFSGTSLFYVLFGVGVGLALASKVSAAPVVLLLPVGAAIYLWGLPEEERKFRFWPVLVNLVLAAIVSLLVFRVFQPYAFSGPGFFNLKLNDKWVANLQSLQAQSNADSDVPFALQWARRPLTFAWSNMVLWGLGIPLGLAAWAAIVWMGWRILRGEWQRHLLIWSWTLGYFAWQSISWVRSMRYQIPVYPTLAIAAAWGIIALWGCGQEYYRERRWGPLHIRWGAVLRVLSVVVGAIAVAGTLAWAFAFTRIYTQPVTRVAASSWVYQNVPGPLNVQLETTQGVINQPLAYRWGTAVLAGQAIHLPFQSQLDGILTDVQFPNVIDRTNNPNGKAFSVSISASDHPDQVLGEGRLLADFDMRTNPMGDTYQITLAIPLRVSKGTMYQVTLADATENTSVFVWGSPLASIYPLDGSDVVRQPILFPVQSITPTSAYAASYLPVRAGLIRQISSPYMVDLDGQPGAKTLRLTLIGSAGSIQSTGSATVQSDFAAGSDPRGKAYTFKLDKPITVSPQQPFTVMIEMVQGEGRVEVYGTWPAVESPWDDPIPVGLGLYTPYDSLSGIYRGDLNFEMYVTDSPAKRQRFENILDQADYIFITSNRQWGSTVRVPERYPMTSAYYRELIGCPDDRDIIWCYSVAQPGMFQGKLGYSLVNVFQSNPHLGPIQFNDQFAEEAFTVYDHPKVLIFKKNAPIQRHNPSLEIERGESGPGGSADAAESEQRAGFQQLVAAGGSPGYPAGWRDLVEPI
jgi:hypothetical protein